MAKKHYERCDDDEAMARKRRVSRLFKQLKAIVRLSSQIVEEELAANTSAGQAASAKRDTQKLAGLQLKEIKSIFTDPKLLDDLLAEIYTTWYLSKQYQDKLANRLINCLQQALANSPIEDAIVKLLNVESFESQLAEFKHYIPLCKHVMLLEEILRIVEESEVKQSQLDETEITQRKKQIRDFCIQQYYAEQQQKIEKLIAKRKQHRKITIALSCLVGLLVAGAVFYLLFMPGILVTVPLNQFIITCVAAAMVMLSVAGIAGSTFYHAVKMFVPFTLPAFYNRANIIVPLQLSAQDKLEQDVAKIIHPIKQELKRTAKQIEQNQLPATPQHREQQEAKARFDQLMGENAEPTRAINDAEGKLSEKEQPEQSKKLLFKTNGKLRKVLSKDAQHYYGSIWQKIRYGIYQQALNHVQQKTAHDDKWHQLANDWLINKQSEENSIIKPSLIAKYCTDIPSRELPLITELKHFTYPRN